MMNRLRYLLARVLSRFSPARRPHSLCSLRALGGGPPKRVTRANCRLRFVRAGWLLASLLIVCKPISLEAKSDLEKIGGVILKGIASWSMIQSLGEVEIGNMFADEIPKLEQSLGGARSDPDLQRQGQELADKESIGPVKFSFLKTDKINAFATLGQNGVRLIYLTDGIWQLAEGDPDAQAGVIGHELGHHAHRDIVKSVREELRTELGVRAILTGTGANKEIQVAASLVSQLFLLKRSRDQEKAADKFAVKLLAASGRDPYGVSRMFQLMREKLGGEPRAFEVISTHPNTEKRIKKTRKRAEEEMNKPRNEFDKLEPIEPEGSSAPYAGRLSEHQQAQRERPKAPAQIPIRDWRQWLIDAKVGERVAQKLSSTQSLPGLKALPVKTGSIQGVVSSSETGYVFGIYDGRGDLKTKAICHGQIAEGVIGFSVLPAKTGVWAGYAEIAKNIQSGAWQFHSPIREGKK